MTIQPPDENTGRALFRAAVEQSVELIPLVGGLITKVFEVTHPSTFERDITEWRSDVSHAVNDHDTRLGSLETRLRPTITLSDMAVDVATWLVRSVEDHLLYCSFEDLKQQFPSAANRDLEEAISELEEVSLVDVTRHIGPQGYALRPTWPLYWLFSPHVLNATPLTDAQQLAQLGVDGDDVWLNAFRLDGELGWGPRRINSAMTMLTHIVPNALRSREVNPCYAVPSIYIDAGARVKLRRFLAKSPA